MKLTGVLKEKVEKLETTEKAKQVIKEAMELKEGFVIDCMIDIDEMVRPMVGGGDHITNFMRI